ncbi:unnamed protein product [Paramecium pentaurelia]|uniref:Uncharacterized protein n=1 Tax=Paramecium pentaurelia TaxID=43138 RepID=A0A8S1VRY9_9CILI|nr:unnamed protein product [Paramecium pentaurelia]
MANKYDVQRFLEKKYAHSQSYYYSKTLNDFVSSARTPDVIGFYQVMAYREDSEYLKRFYCLSELFQKLRLFTEYYKYHNEIPRFFMPYLCEIMSNYHDKRRRIEYYRIKRIIEEENRNNPNKPKKAIVGDSPQDAIPTSPKLQQVYSKILSGIQDASTTIETINNKLNALQINVGELNLQPSNREQEQLQNFIQFMVDKQKLKTITQYVQLNSPKTYNKLPIGVSQQTIKQIISRTQKNQQTFHLSPKTGQDVQFQGGAYTQRILKDPLQKMLTPAQIYTMHSPLNHNHNNTAIQLKSKISSSKNKQQSLSLSKQFKISDAIRLPLRMHQHTRSDVRFYRK